MKRYALSIAMLSLFAGLGWAQETTAGATSEPVPVPITVTPTPTSSASPVSFPQKPVVQNVVAWSELQGTVQSVDRYNHALQVRDREGKVVDVTFDPNIHAFRRGETVTYQDLEPNDEVVLEYSDPISVRNAD